MNGSFLNDKKVQLVASWAAIHDPSLSSSPLSVWLLSQESDSTLIDTWQRLGAYGCLRALGRQKVHTMHLSPVTDAPLIVREQRAVWWGDDQHLGDLSYFYKHIQPQEAQAALSYETFYTRFSAWLELRHQVCCLEDSPVGMVMFIPDGLALPALADLWQVFVRHVFSGVELQKTFMLLLNSISLADRGFSVPELPLITRAQVDLMLAFFYATLHAIEQRLKRLDHEATATTKETALKKLNERRLSQHATYDGALLHFQAIVDDAFYDITKGLAKVINEFCEKHQFSSYLERDRIVNGAEREEKEPLVYGETLRLDPNDEYALDRQISDLMKLERHEEALQVCDKTLQLYPDDDYAWLKKGCIHQKLKQHIESYKAFEKALELYEEILSLDPFDWYALYGQISVLQNLGRYEEVLQTCEDMFCVDPDSEHAWNNKGLALKEIGNDKEAMLAFEKVLQIRPRNRDALNNKGALLEKMGQHEEALELFETILQSDDDMSVLNNKGVVLNALKLSH